ncbi:MAG: hypothetical protein JXB18_14050, partial [Sedimentisphaerales bacterium]|nr:hypothetical protein [Sedimentisphaerales bacterium]
MFKNMKLSMKISLGFALLLFIAIMLGGLASWSMTNVKTTTTTLSEQNIPAVGLANEVERNSLVTMYAARGYAFTEETGYLDEARKNLTVVFETIKKSHEHAEQFNDTDSAEKANLAITKAAEYQKLLDETVVITGKLQEIQKTANTVAKEYMDVCSEFFKDQTNKLNEEIETALTKGNAAEENKLGADKLKERYAKTELCNEIIHLGDGVRVEFWKAIALRNPKMVEEALKNFDAINQKLDDLKAITVHEVNLKQIEGCRTASGKYKQCMSNYLTNWLAREDLGKKRTVAGNEVLDSAKTIATTAMEETTEASQSAAKSLGTATTTMFIGLGIGVVVGISLSFFITRSITLPINRIIGELREGAEQVASASTQVSAASQSLAQGATEQAAGLEETSS